MTRDAGDLPFHFTEWMVTATVRAGGRSDLGGWSEDERLMRSRYALWLKEGGSPILLSRECTLTREPWREVEVTE